VTPSYAPASPIDLVNPESLPGSCTGATAMAGYPLLTVPTELAAGLPVAVSFWGAAHSETSLVEIAHGYEQAWNRTSGPLPEPSFPRPSSDGQAADGPPAEAQGVLTRGSEGPRFSAGPIRVAALG